MLINEKKNPTRGLLITAPSLLRTSYAMACTLPQVRYLILKQGHGSQVFGAEVKLSLCLTN
jgi:hypothetical protein